MSAFADEIAALMTGITEETCRAEREAFLRPLQAAVDGLQRSGFGAALKNDKSHDYAISIWPLHRPGWASHLLGGRVMRGGFSVRAHDTVLTTETEMQTWLRSFFQSKPVRMQLSLLREQALESVTAVITQGEGQPGCLVTVDPHVQTELVRTRGLETTLRVTLQEGETLRSGDEVGSLVSAGVQRTVLRIRRERAGNLVYLTLAPD